jgi:hypothetical protein
MNWLKRIYWKRRLKVRYLAYRSMLDNYSCGGTLAEYISPRLWRAKQKVNAAIRKLKAVDPVCKIKELA